MCVEVGGTITGEHGVGVEKINQMCVQFGAAGARRVPRREARLRPAGLLNPGKAVPTLARCAEYGAHARARRQAAASRAAALLTVEHFSANGFATRPRAARALRLRGGGTKDFYGNAPRGEVLDTRGYAGIVAYEPTELVVTARCGTPLAELESALGAERQMPAVRAAAFRRRRDARRLRRRRPVRAAARGRRRAARLRARREADRRPRRRLLRFGGQVMKNVAGYDVSRLLAGSLGTLGLIAEVSLKVLPRPQPRRRCASRWPQARAIEAMNRWAGQPLPISATAWHDGELSVRLSGAAAGGARRGGASIGGEACRAQAARSGPASASRRDPFFAGAEPLWRLVAAVRPRRRCELAGRQLIEWGGGAALAASRRAEPRRCARPRSARGGHATLFRAARQGGGLLRAARRRCSRALHRELKAAFDPAGILNPGRMYAEL